MAATDPGRAESMSGSLTTADLSVQVRGLNIHYRVYEETRLTARELFRRGFRSRDAVDVHAVKDVDLDVGVGEAVGIVGSNGSGKSTLLRSIAGLQAKTSGTVLVRGEPHLLGVNAALKPLLSGYRNIILGGLAMGLSLAEIEQQMDDVVEFSGLGGAVARPLQTYSSGMRSRLAFSIATLRVPEVLLIDEALAVGDKEFRARSLQRIREIRKEAHTVLLVSHNLNEIRQTCDRTVWLEQGVVRADGETAETLELYESS
jgi:teichoic acid transport system ATP-binding protein